MRALHPFQALNNFVFTKLHGNNIIYNQCWEDPQIDKACLKLKPNDSMLVLTSAGCNILDYCLSQVKEIHAVDLNYRQNALLELKMIMIEKLDYEIFFAFFGKGRLAHPAKIYRQNIRSLLSQTSAEFWDKYIELFNEDRKVGFYYSTTTGGYARLVNYICRRVLGLNHLFDALCEAETLEEQAAVYEQIEPRLFSKLWASLWSFPTLLSLIGVPVHQLHLVSQQYPGGAKQFLQDALRYVMTHTHLKQDNYFWLVYLLGEYTRDCCPAYLKEPNFNQLKKMNLRNVIQLQTSSVLNFVKTHPRKIDKFILLDHMDWLSRKREQAILQEQWQAIIDIAAPNAQILFRTAGIHINWMKDIRIRHNHQVKPLFECLTFDNELSTRLHAQDRVHTYGSFYIGEVG